ncbi:uncharacterized protein LOC143343943 isoform X2 [Colletes latitarsis]|uniref:uncharacterized protein LOC143343943 isoform X2 n=1 Tax=Colletes latitarsis TaxID=2605962 RepID=UPI0040365B66
MWMSSLPIVSLLICVVVGNPEIDQFKNGRNVSKEGLFEVEKMRKEPDPNAIVAENETQHNKNIECDLGVDSNMNIAAKKRTGTESSLDLTPKGKEFQDLFQKKDRWVYWWGDKRVSLYGPNLCIRESIRVPFDQGKPSYSLSNVLTRVKRDNFMYDRNERDNRGSWGGKRAQETFDRKPSRVQYLMTIMRPTLNDARVFSNLKDKFLNGETIENAIDENENPVHVNNETNENDYPTEEEIIDDDNDWVMSTPSKRAQRREVRNKKIRRKPQKFRGLVRFVKSTFYPWGG